MPLTLLHVLPQQMYGQAWVHPRDGARLWPFFLQLQQQYKFKLVAPCVSNAGGAKWWLDAWWGNCTAMHGPEGCKFDFACTHAYFYPETAPGQGCDGLPDWVCASTMMDMIEGLSKRFGGKQVWASVVHCFALGLQPINPSFRSAKGGSSRGAVPSAA